MLVKARKQIISNPQAVHEVLSKVLGAENEVDRMKEHFRVVFLSCRDRGLSKEEVLKKVSMEMGHRRGSITLRYLLPAAY